MRKIAKFYFTLSLCVVISYFATFALIKFNAIPIYKDKLNYAYVNTNKLNVRSSPSTNSRVLKQINKRTNIDIIDRENKWLYIKSKQRRISGWVYGDFVNTAAQESQLYNIFYHWLYWSNIPNKSKYSSIVPILNILLWLTILVFFPIYFYNYLKTRNLRKLSKRSWLKFSA